MRPASSSFVRALAWSALLHGLFAAALVGGALLAAHNANRTELSARAGEAVASVRLRFSPARRDSGARSVPEETSDSESAQNETAPGAATRAGLIAESVSELQRRIEYPALAREMGMEGRVRIEALVDQEGRVKRARILESSGFDVLDRAARRGVESWRFPPAQKPAGATRNDGGRRIEIPVRFRSADR